MNNSKNKIDILIGKSVSGNATAEETEELEKWMALLPENKKIVQKSKNIWEKSQNWISTEKTERDKSEVKEKAQKHLNLQLFKVRRKLLIYKIAAIMAIPITFAISWYFIKNPDYQYQENQLCTVTTPKGHISKCILPDGSEIWINANSTIEYNPELFNKKNREIKLTGEAYFNVFKNKMIPFTVTTPVADINVTGTSFNVKAYPESQLFEAVLAEGNIEMKLKNQNNQIVELLPGERAVYNFNEKSISIDNVDVEMFSSWRNGEIIFKDATLNDLIKELERIYDIQFHVTDPRLREFRFRGMFSYNNNLIDALEKIKRTAEIDYYIENKEVWLSKK